MAASIDHDAIKEVKNTGILLELIVLLLENGADINAKDIDKETLWI